MSEEVLQAEKIISPEFESMFEHKTKLLKLVSPEKIAAYKTLYRHLRELQRKGELPMHPENNYIGESELVHDIYKRKYYLKNFEGNCIEKRPEDVFTRLAAAIASLEENHEKQKIYSEKFYKLLYEGIFLPGGRVIAGAGDLYRLKTLANCFVSLIEEDNIESIYQTAYECARTYSYGGGIGVDISNLRPRNSVVHNAADKSTGAVSFMEIYSLTTGLIGQSGRRGALMLTIDVKHPDILDFINVKQKNNWVTSQIIHQCKMSGMFDDKHLAEIEKQVRDNTQIRFANISVKVSDEFMQAVEEQKSYGPNRILVYKKQNKAIMDQYHNSKETNYAHNIPSKDIEEYELYADFDNIEKLNEFLTENHNVLVAKEQLDDKDNRDMFGDYVLTMENEKYDLAIKYAGDFMLYYSSAQAGAVKNLVKAKDIWNEFVKGNYKTAEPGLIFWSTMTKYSPSNYLGKPIASTNPCGEVPLEDGGACNLASINLSRCVVNGYTPDARIDWKMIKNSVQDIVRFLDNVISWNQTLNPLEKQRKAAKETRRIGLGYMGIADMLNQLGIGYDSEEGIATMDKVASFIANVSYQASAQLAAEKGPIPIWNYDVYAQNPFFQEVLDEETQEMIKKYGLRNVAVLSIAPTGTISNVILGYKDGNKNYVGVSGGIEPIFSLYYQRRSESFGNKVYKIFHPTVQAYIDKNELQEKVNEAQTTEELMKVLPEHFFRTAHYIKPEKRVEVQSTCQRYIDHSISSTVNLPESIEPEVISDVYLQAWRKKLKGITIYRDGSRFPILSVAQQQTKFSTAKEKKYRVMQVAEEKIIKGDEVMITPDGRLTTPFHEMQKDSSYIIHEAEEDAPKKRDDVKVVGGACKVELVDGKLVKSCGD